MENKKYIIKGVTSEIGWADRNLKWLQKREALCANKNRERLLGSLSRYANYNFSKNKLHIGGLSPGCLICGQGYWSCMYINFLCTSNCFFCPQNRKIKKESPPKAQGIVFNNPTDYIDYLKIFNFKGVGFSGGESLLVFEKLLTYIRKIRQSFGNKFYIWVYTNGALVTKDKLRQLKKAGLDEIRFNISARRYRLDAVELASHFINTVTIEIPCIPEDYEILKKCLIRIKKINVKYLNLHQLETSAHNYKKFKGRNYTFLHQHNFPILESEIFAIKLMKFALDRKINLPINYCSSAYKWRLQQRGLRQRYAVLAKDHFEDLTNLGYIRHLSIQDLPTKINKIVKMLRKNKCPESLYTLNDRKTKIILSSLALAYSSLEGQSLSVNYFEPRLVSGFIPNKLCKKITLPSGKNLFLIKEPIFQWEMPVSMSQKSVQKLFIEPTNSKQALSYFIKNYNLNSKDDIYKMQRDLDSLGTIEALERLQEGFPEIY